MRKEGNITIDSLIPKRRPAVKPMFLWPEQEVGRTVEETITNSAYAEAWGKIQQLNGEAGISPSVVVENLKSRAETWNVTLLLDHTYVWQQNLLWKSSARQ